MKIQPKPRNHIPSTDSCGPEIVFAISRRFKVAAIDSLARDIVEPALSSLGVALTCTYAEDDPSHPDHWINRMGFIFDLADVHIVFDLDRSGNTFYEFEASNLANFMPSGEHLYWMLGVRCTQRLQPFRIIIHDQPRRYMGRSPTYYSDPLRIRRNRILGTTVLVRFDADALPSFVESFKAALALVIKATRLSVDAAETRETQTAEGRLGDDLHFHDAEEDEPLFPVSEYRELRVALAKRIATGLTPVDLANEIFARVHCETDAANEATMFEVHDAASLAEYAASAISLGRAAAGVIAKPDDIQARSNLVVTALALRFSLLQAGSQWSVESLDFQRGLLQRLVRGPIRPLMALLMGKVI